MGTNLVLVRVYKVQYERLYGKIIYLTKIFLELLHMLSIHKYVSRTLAIVTS